MSCFDVSDRQQLYLLELEVKSLDLEQEIITDYNINKKPLHVKIKFLSLPIFDISQFEFKSVKKETINNEEKKINGSLIFSSGRSCIFSKKSIDLVREMQTTPVTIGVFLHNDKYPIGNGILQLTGCLCDQVAMSMNDEKHLPKPYTLNGKYKINDSGKNKIGFIGIELKITCFGKYVTMHYQMKKNSFIFMSDRDEGQYFVKRVVPPSQEEEEEQEQDEIKKVKRASVEIIHDSAALKHDDKKEINKTKKKNAKKK